MRTKRTPPTAAAARLMPSACACENNAADDDDDGVALSPEDDINDDAGDRDDDDADETSGADEADEDVAGISPQGRMRSRSRATGRRAARAQAFLRQQGCACGGGEPPQVVFALGALWFDFGTEARYDAIVQQMGDPVRANTPAELFNFLRQSPQFASGITFILMQDQIPLYAVQPAGPFALATYEAMLDALSSCLDEGGGEQRVSLPGLISGSTRLMNGMVLPVIYPDLRGMYKWRSEDLIEATRGAATAEAGEASEDEILNFLNRVYYELRNLGVAPQERAINFAATNAYQSRQAFSEATARHLVLDAITVTKSPICRPDSDCWDVELTMFDPENELRASRVYRYTVDVSEPLPVTVGPIRTWASRGGVMSLRP